MFPLHVFIGSTGQGFVDGSGPLWFCCACTQFLVNLGYVQSLSNCLCLSHPMKLSIKSLVSLTVDSLSQTVPKPHPLSAAGYSSSWHSNWQCCKLSEAPLPVTVKQLVFALYPTLIELLQLIELGAGVMGAAPARIPHTHTVLTQRSVIFKNKYFFDWFSERWSGCFWVLSSVIIVLVG